MQHRFFALISRMRYIGRWGLAIRLRKTFRSTAIWLLCWHTDWL